MIHNVLCREVSAKTRHQDASSRTDAPRGPSPALCDVILKSLTRDNQLRRKYVQRRWQGLVDCVTVVSHDECRERETILANLPTQKPTRAPKRQMVRKPASIADARADEVT